jgi:hypothetical protein
MYGVKTALKEEANLQKRHIKKQGPAKGKMAPPVFV